MSGTVAMQPTEQAPGDGARSDSIESKKKLEVSKLQVVVTALPALTAGLYAVGAMYYDSYLGRYGIESTLFLLPIDRVLYYGFRSTFSLAFVPLINAMAIATFVTLIVLMVGGFWQLPAGQAIQAAVKRKLKSLIGRWAGASLGVDTHPTPPFIQLAEALFKYLVGTFLVFIPIVVAVFASTWVGTKHAESE